MNWIKSPWFLPLASIPTLGLSLYKGHGALFLLTVFFAIVWIAIHLPKLRPLFTVFASLCFTVFLFELSLFLIHKYNYLYPKSSGTVVGWTDREFYLLHSKAPKKSETVGDTWVLNKVENLHHGYKHPEYDYFISTTQCSKYFVRGSCFINPESWHFGDSFAFGFGIKESDTFVGLTAKRSMRSISAYLVSTRCRCLSGPII